MTSQLRERQRSFVFQGQKSLRMIRALGQCFVIRNPHGWHSMKPGWQWLALKIAASLFQLKTGAKKFCTKSGAPFFVKKISAQKFWRAGLGAEFLCACLTFPDRANEDKRSNTSVVINFCQCCSWVHKFSIPNNAPTRWQLVSCDRRNDVNSSWPHFLRWSDQPQTHYSTN